MRMYGIMAATSLAVGVVAGSALEAATIGYWRFEEGAFLSDSSGNGHTLTPWHGSTSGSMTSAYRVAAPTGFFDPIPQTSAANKSAARLEAPAAGGTRLTAADNVAFTSNTLTLELMTRLVANQVNLGFLAGHFNATDSQRSYAMTVSNDGNRVVMQLSALGTSAVAVNSPFQLTVDRDYYLAAAISTGATPADRYVTFYRKDLTDPASVLESATVSHAVESLHNAATPFAIGAQGNGGSAANLNAIIDEVRLSNVVLDQSQLLAVVPEPASLGLLGMLGAGLIARRRR